LEQPIFPNHISARTEVWNVLLALDSISRGLRTK
jgi:hypothetical protein